MKDKLIAWFDRNRKPIVYTVGWLNVIGGVNSLLQSRINEGVVWLLLGTIILFDARR